MKKLFIGSILLLGLIALMSTTADARRLANRTGLEFGIGFQDQIGNDEISYYYEPYNKVNFNNVTGSIGINYWMSENMAFNFSISVVDSDVETWVDYNGVHEYNYAVVPMMAGFKMYLAHPRYLSDFRPYVSMAAGPVIRSIENKYATAHLTSIHNTETVVGAKLGGGVDILMGRNFIFGLNGGYNFISEFDTRPDLQQEYSGAEIGFKFGFVFGGDDDNNDNKRKKRGRGITRVRR